MQKFYKHTYTVLAILLLSALILACEEDDSATPAVILNPLSLVIEGGEIEPEIIQVRMNQPAVQEVRVIVAVEHLEGSTYNTTYITEPEVQEGKIEVVIPAGNTMAEIVFTPRTVARRRIVRFHIEEVQNAVLNAVNTAMTVEIQAASRVLPNDFRTIHQMRRRFNEGELFITDDIKITTVITSVAGAVQVRDMFVQDHTAGASIRFPSAHGFAQGDSVNINLNGAELVNADGLFRIEGLSAASIEKIATVALPDPISATSVELNNGKYQGQRVLVTAANFLEADGTATFNGLKTIQDGHGIMSVWTESTAAYATASLPEGSQNIIAIASSRQNEAVLRIMNAEDVSSGPIGGGGVISLPFTTDFESCTADFSTPEGFIEEFGPGSKTDRGWGCRAFGVDGSRAANASSFGGSAGDDDAWLIIDGKLNFTNATDPVIEFWISSGFEGPGELKVVYAENYAGVGDPYSATWTSVEGLSAQFPAKGSGANGAKVVSAGLTALVGKQVHIAFHWSGANNTASASYAIDNLSIRNQ